MLIYSRVLTLHEQQEICNLCVCDYIFNLIEFLIIPGSPFLSWFPLFSGKYLRNEQPQEVNEVEKFWSQSACSQGQVSVLCWGHVTAFCKLGSCVSASSYMRLFWHLCSES